MPFLTVVGLLTIWSATSIGRGTRPHHRPGRLLLAVVPGRCGGAGRRRHPGRDALPADQRRRGGRTDRQRARHTQPDHVRRAGERDRVRGAPVRRPRPAGRPEREPGRDAAPPRPGRGGLPPRGPGGTGRRRHPARPRAGRRPAGGAPGRLRPHGPAVWIRAPESIEDRFGTSRAGAVDVALYTTASVNAVIPAHPKADWEQLRTVEKGRRSPLASLRPAPAPTPAQDRGRPYSAATALPRPPHPSRPGRQPGSAALPPVRPARRGPHGRCRGRWRRGPSAGVRPAPALPPPTAPGGGGRNRSGGRRPASAGRRACPGRGQLASADLLCVLQFLLGQCRTGRRPRRSAAASTSNTPWPWSWTIPASTACGRAGGPRGMRRGPLAFGRAPISTSYHPGCSPARAAQSETERAHRNGEGQQAPRQLYRSSEPPEHACRSCCRTGKLQDPRQSQTSNPAGVRFLCWQLSSSRHGGDT